MELRHLRYFVAVAEQLHFGRAARRLHISQPPLSAQIRDLERELGVLLFVRSYHQVELTDAGRAMLSRARDVLARVSALGAEAASVGRGEQGVVTIGYTTTAAYELLPRLLRLARERAPRITLRLDEMASPAQPAALLDGRVDLGLACLPVVAPAVHSLPLVQEHITVALPAAHPLLRRARVRFTDLVGVAQVGLRDSPEPGWAQGCASALARAAVVAPVVAEADTKLALLGLVAAGVGVAIVSSSLASLSRPGVVFRPIVDARDPLVLGALHRPAPSPLVTAILAIAKAAAQSPGQAPSAARRRPGAPRGGRATRATAK